MRWGLWKKPMRRPATTPMDSIPARLRREIAADAVYRCSAACRERAEEHARAAEMSAGNGWYFRALAAEAEACAATCDQQRRGE